MALYDSYCRGTWSNFSAPTGLYVRCGDSRERRRSRIAMANKRRMAVLMSPMMMYELRMRAE